MGTILQLNRQSRISVRHAETDPSPSAEVIIFPGVRIERHDAAWIAGLEEPTEAGGSSDRPRRSS
jgi:hypothetical protein